MSNIHILQFEFFDDFYGRNVFLKVHATFKHHYTGETMRYIQCDYVVDANAFSYFGVLNEAEFLDCYNHRVGVSEDVHMETN